MDEVDKGNETAEQTLQGYIDRIRARAAAASIRPTGFCFNCGEESKGRLFCCSECGSDFEKREQANRRNK